MSIPPTETTDGSNRFSAAAPDAFVTDERTPVIGNVLADNGHGPDPATPLLISGINGSWSSGLIGSTIMLASGALLTVNDDGSFAYDPTGAFGALDPGETVVDSFTYTGQYRTQEGRTFSGMATVCIEIEGVAGNVAGSPGPVDFILGTVGDDALRGTGSGDRIHALEGDDTVAPGDGANTIDGGKGHDTVVYTGTRADYDHDLQADAVVVERRDGEADTLLNIERVQFEDGALLFDEEIDRSHLEIAYRFYSAGFGRAADEEGLRYWIDRLGDLDPSLSAERFMADSFVASDEFRDLYGVDLNNAGYVDAMYRNALGRAADDAGHAFWTDAMDHGLGRDDLLIAFALSDENGQQIAPNLDDGVWVL